ncbi:hypothetical protein ASG12_05840 [Williamsia sp. Leaf354]|nr:hypothetical protein ASG12_05840 [Williamsia sp. Leaf354]
MVPAANSRAVFGQTGGSFSPVIACIGSNAWTACNRFFGWVTRSFVCRNSVTVTHPTIRWASRSETSRMRWLPMDSNWRTTVW